MDKLKEKLHIRRKSQPDTSDVTTGDATRASIDSELAAMSPEERDAYLKEFEDADRTGEPKKGSLIEKLIARGNKRTEEQLQKESLARQKEVQDAGGVIR
ncbi:hypothetical protein BU24DRAFT_345888 [Aaosphaeria arxii CBS 175.79]|uniref:Uncharacterized protein n=1 Tax=Aaosphaeria arxii CBS 175.79 TaxID=1450172 RepID=A0A6A5XYQ0_9PLEO|nr:uncharacterized protein BU24DRAFT_345888 [Aaosphaeria arxii CBS 175.79]KAF2017404.1 hypothetical protein BU24DRAFT_345888 [Aaosphaeria arxii CBS 175.79]